MIKDFEFKSVQSMLATWRDVRGLSVEEQKKNFNVNFTEELSEFFKAERENDEYGMIDALCDMIVIAINAGQSQGISEEGFSYCNLTKPLREPNSGVYCLLVELFRRGYNPYLCLIETIRELESRTGAWNEKEGKWIKDKGAYTKEEALEKIQCKPDVEREDSECWIFTLFFGSHWGKREVKIKKWYKADYSKCKLEE